MDLENLEQLETKIRSLLDQHAKVRKEKELVERQLQQRESEFDALKGRIRRFERERAEIRGKLEKILSQFEHLGLL